MNIIFENEHFVAVDKPSGWLSVVSRDRNDPRPCLALELQSRALQGVRIWPCHRLDVEVSGLILFAKSSEAHRAANGWFEFGKIHKTYEAISEKSSDLELRAKIEEQVEVETRWRSQIAKGKKRAFESSHGKEAITLATLIDAAKKIPLIGNCWHWKLKPLTGRPHQLRYELYKRQAPILGDRLYSSSQSFSLNGIALRALELNFDSKVNKSWGLPDTIVVAPFSI